eukprot:gene3181-3652_t
MAQTECRLRPQKAGICKDNSRMIQKYRSVHELEDKTRRNFSKVLLAVNFNHAFYENIPLINEYYSGVFDKIVYCGPEKADKGQREVLVVEGAKGHFGYMCIAMAIKRHPGFLGYMYVNDDMIVNWWTLVDLPRDKIWFSKDIVNKAGAEMGKPAPCCWHWWTSVAALENCKKAFDSLERTAPSWNGELNMKDYYANTGGKKLCLRSWSDFMYIPKRLANKYVRLAGEFYKEAVFLEVAVSTLITMLDRKENRANIDGIYLPDKFGDVDFSDGVSLASVYSTTKSLYHPVKLSSNGIGLNIFKNIAMEYGRLYLKYLSKNHCSHR